MESATASVALNVGLGLLAIGLFAGAASIAPVKPVGMRQAIELMCKRTASDKSLRLQRSRLVSLVRP